MNMVTEIQDSIVIFSYDEEYSTTAGTCRIGQSGNPQNAYDNGNYRMSTRNHPQDETVKKVEN